MDKEVYVNMFANMASQIYDVMFEGNMMSVKIVYTDDYNGGMDNKKMEYAHPGDSGFDLRAQNNETGLYDIAPGGTIIIPVGIKVSIPKGTELQVRTRSGSPLKKGFVVANSPGTVDSSYTGIIGVICHNITDTLITIESGERIAQGVICPVFQVNFIEVAELDDTERGDGAYNSTGVT
ncbi:MAG: Deoxyuridine 5'-triphosphate nucleotidohydrolase [Candidatus Izimaplasma bacterium HR2]|nr:MAG: Deoxyuridine 5'-triphosphate nucleotidohydrolase [Candidatus Izimaplasma bacterium HR2]